MRYITLENLEHVVGIVYTIFLFYIGLKDHKKEKNACSSKRSQNQ